MKQGRQLKDEAAPHACAGRRREVGRELNQHPFRRHSLRRNRTFSYTSPSPKWFPLDHRASLAPSPAGWSAGWVVSLWSRRLCVSCQSADFFPRPLPTTSNRLSTRAPHTDRPTTPTDAHRHSFVRALDCIRLGECPPGSLRVSRRADEGQKEKATRFTQREPARGERAGDERLERRHTRPCPPGIVPPLTRCLVV